MKRWKMHYPLLRCPGCRRWCFIDAHGQFKLRLASKKQIADVRGEDAANETSTL